MNSKTEYRTKHKAELMDYLETVQGEHITVSDVCEYFKHKGSPMGQTTVYRQLERLVDEGLVSKYIIDSSSPACFEYMGAEAHAGQGTCFHCKCEKCGRLIHLHCGELDEILGHLKNEHRFTMDTRRTVFYGLCDECASALGQEA